MRSPRITAKSSPGSLQLEKGRAQQLRPNTAKNKINYLIKNKTKSPTKFWWLWEAFPDIPEIDKGHSLPTNTSSGPNPE